ncbi:FHIPEP family type III secretion protein, partial [Aeromonas hydrophila]|uniref:FHIPEP family type III secretion protein n=1 Tax=Aeromonas hydrophila TaxID=644 RepID=UPI0036DF9077
QIPSLLLSIAAAIIVTRQNTDQDMGTAVLGQLFDNPKALIISSGILLMMGLVPGMPHFAFLSLGCVASVGAWWLLRREKLAAARAAKGELMPANAEQPTHE